MNVNGIASATAQTGVAAATQPEESVANVASDFETFLTLLTAQMRNQDPLNPMDSTAFVAQLAEFSGVEQQVRSNDTLSAILAAVSGGSGQLANLVGKEVQVETFARYDGDSVEIAFDPDPAAISAQLIVRDSEGTIVARLPADPAAGSALWDGTLDEGEAEEGLYRISQSRLGADGLSEEVQGRVFATVSELRLTPDGPRLALDTGDVVEESAVRAIRG